MIASTALALLGATASAHAQQDPSETYGTTAPAESRDYFKQRLAAPRRAVELTAGTGYTQGFGSLERGVGMPSVVTPGLAVDIGAFYRRNPHWAAGVTGQYQELNAQRASSARGLTPGLAVAYQSRRTSVPTPGSSLAPAIACFGRTGTRLSRPPFLRMASSREGHRWLRRTAHARRRGRPRHRRRSQPLPLARWRRRLGCDCRPAPQHLRVHRRARAIRFLRHTRLWRDPSRCESPCDPGLTRVARGRAGEGLRPSARMRVTASHLRSADFRPLRTSGLSANACYPRGKARVVRRSRHIVPHTPHSRPVVRKPSACKVH